MSATPILKLVSVVTTAVTLLACRSEGLCTKLGVKAEVEGNHAHLLRIPAEAVERGIGGAYRVEGSEHEHAVIFSDDDFKKLASGAKVEVRTTSVEAHVHNVIVECKK